MGGGSGPSGAGKVGHSVCDTQAGGRVAGCLGRRHPVLSPTRRKSWNELWPAGTERTNPPHIQRLWRLQGLNNFHGLDSGLQVPTGHTSARLPAPGERTAFSFPSTQSCKEPHQLHSGVELGWGFRRRG